MIFIYLCFLCTYSSFIHPASWCFWLPSCDGRADQSLSRPGLSNRTAKDSLEALILKLTWRWTIHHL